jgi:hypothetical protein
VLQVRIRQYRKSPGADEITAGVQQGRGQLVADVRVDPVPGVTAPQLAERLEVGWPQGLKWLRADAQLTCRDIGGPVLPQPIGHRRGRLDSHQLAAVGKQGAGELARSGSDLHASRRDFDPRPGCRAAHEVRGPTRRPAS